MIAKAYNTVLTPDQKTKADTLRHTFDRMSQRFQEQTSQPTTTTNQ